MRYPWLILPVIAFAPILAQAQAQFVASDGGHIPGAVIECTTAGGPAVPCDDSVPLAVRLPAGFALDGIDGTGVTPSAGGVGIRGWLSSIYKSLSNTLNVAGVVSVTNFPAIQAVSGAVSAPIGVYQNGSLQLASGTTALIFSAPIGGVRVRIKLQNYDSVNDIWCRWGQMPSVGDVGSFKLAANGGGIDDSGAGVNQLALSCIASAGAPVLYAEEY